MTLKELIHNLKELEAVYGPDAPVFKRSVNACTGRVMFSPVLQVYNDKRCSDNAVVIASTSHVA